MDKFNISPVELNEKSKRAGGIIKSNYKKIISASLLLMIVFTMVMELSVDMEFTMRDVGSFILLIAIYILNLIVNADDGKDAGKRDRRYLDGSDRYMEINEKVVSSGSSRYLDAFCRDRRENNLIERRRLALSRANIGYAKYLREYIGRPTPRDLPRDKRRAITAANKMKMENLTPSMLLTAGKKEANQHIIGEDPVKRYRTAILSKILGAAVLTLIMADITGTDVGAPTMVRIAAGVAKLISYMASGYFGYYTGYNHIAIDVVAYMTQQTRLLHEFDAWKAEHESELFRLIPHVDEDQVPEGMDALTGEIIRKPPEEKAEHEAKDCVSG